MRQGVRNFSGGWTIPFGLIFTVLVNKALVVEKDVRESAGRREQFKKWRFESTSGMGSQSMGLILGSKNQIFQSFQARGVGYGRAFTG